MTDTPSDDTEPTTTRLSAHKSTLIALLFATLVLMSVGSGLAQQDADVADDFEDGNLRIEHDGWTGWTDDDIALTEDAIEGSFSAEFPWDPNEDNPNSDIRRDTNTTALDEITAEVRIDNQTDDTNVDSFKVLVRDTDGTELTRVAFMTTTGTSGTNDIVAGPFGDDDVLISDWDTNTVYTVTFDNWDFDAGEVNVTVSGGGESGTSTKSFNTNDAFGRVEFDIDTDGISEPVNPQWDNVEVYTGARYQIDGEVTDQNGSPIRDITIAANDSSTTWTTTTNRTGHYEFTGLENGTYTVETEAPGYVNDSATVTIAGASETQDFELVSKDEWLSIDVRSFIEHDQTVPYEVRASVIEDGRRVRKDVTADSIVTSANTSVFTVDEVNKELVGTSDQSVNARSFVTAEWEDSNGETRTVEKNITVANKTVANFDLLPTWSRVSATFSDNTARMIFYATTVGATVAFIATSFSGLGALVLMMIAGWLMGDVNDGVLIATVLMATFVGLNVAGNVDYTVNR